MKDKIIVWLTVLVLGALSWVVNCAVIRVICACFGLPFSLRVATGVWLVLCLLRWTLTRSGD